MASHREASRGRRGLDYRQFNSFSSVLRWRCLGEVLKCSLMASNSTFDPCLLWLKHGKFLNNSCIYYMHIKSIWNNICSISLINQKYFVQETFVLSSPADEAVYDGTVCVICNTASGKTLTGKFYHNLHFGFSLQVLCELYVYTWSATRSAVGHTSTSYDSF